MSHEGTRFRLTPMRTEDFVKAVGGGDFELRERVEEKIRRGMAEPVQVGGAIRMHQPDEIERRCALLRRLVDEGLEHTAVADADYEHYTAAALALAKEFAQRRTDVPLRSDGAPIEKLLALQQDLMGRRSGNLPAMFGVLVDGRPLHRPRPREFDPLLGGHRIEARGASFGFLTRDELYDLLELLENDAIIGAAAQRKDTFEGGLLADLDDIDQASLGLLVTWD